MPRLRDETKKKDVTTSFRINPEANALLDKLERKLGTTRSDTLTRAIHQLAYQELVVVSPKEVEQFAAEYERRRSELARRRQQTSAAE